MKFKTFIYEHTENSHSVDAFVDGVNKFLNNSNYNIIDINTVVSTKPHGYGGYGNMVVYTIKYEDESL